MSIALMIFYLILFAIPGFVAFIKFFKYLSIGKSYFERHHFYFIETISIVILPLVFVWGFDFFEKNNCCSDSAVFSPDHRYSIYLLILLSIGFYFYSALRRSISSPLVEILTNCFLIIGIVLNIFIGIHLKEWMFWLPGNAPIIMLFILMIIKNQYLFLQYYETTDKQARGSVENFICKVLTLPLLQKIPLLVVLCFPVLMVLICLLLFIGQKPDSIIRAFTDTYKHGFSELDYQCQGVVCGGHFLCTIAAKGHEDFVKPLRTGVRGGQVIVCNRQLLVSNAFEELLEQKASFIHRPIRKLYNIIGSYIHRYYGVFQSKYISDLIYLFMKPLEWFFLIVLYFFDKNPENRIEQQYLSRHDIQQLKTLRLK